jgi:hypothetical protein
VCKSKRKGGLGIKDLRKMNISLVCKWWWYLENAEGLWKVIVRMKYVHGTPTCLIPHIHVDSPIWRDLLSVRHIYLRGRVIKVKSGKMVSF